MLTLHPPAQETDIAGKLEAMGRAYKAASNADERIYYLLGAVNLCGPFRPLPNWLFKALSGLLVDHLPQKPDRHSWRWLMVREGRQTQREGHSKKPSWEEAYQYASEQLIDTRWAGSERTMKASYQIFERKRRIGQRRRQ